uniref:CD9 molecule a n=1 Tax=Amphilophus citrinellus TaxID=61819 RepID=A0A3Q0T721_AMPCI
TMAALSGGETCIKYLMFAFNLVFWLAGTAVLAIGLWLRLDQKTKGLFEGPESPYVFYTGVYILIGAGALMMVVGFLGCCGAIRESPCMLGLFFFFLLIIFAIEVAAGIWGFSNQSKVTLTNYSTQSPHALRLSFMCAIPQVKLSKAVKKTQRNHDYLLQSCPDAIDEVFDSKLHIIGGVGITIGVIMVFGMIFSMLLCCAIRRSREVV